MYMFASYIYIRFMYLYVFVYTHTYMYIHKLIKKHVYETILGQMSICTFVFILSGKYPYIKIGFIFKGLNDILRVL